MVRGGGAATLIAVPVLAYVPEGSPCPEAVPVATLAAIIERMPLSTFGSKAAPVCDGAVGDALRCGACRRPASIVAATTANASGDTVVAPPSEAVVARSN